jgi:agmatine/peptidylarginine deiminase
MPIQVSLNNFIQFVYNPDYLQSKKWIKSISNVDSICDKINFKRSKSDIVLDGGNVTKTTDKVIMCDKIFFENPHYSRRQLSNKLKELYEIDKLYFVPQQPKDFTGHADGMVRFLDNNTVIVNDYSQENKDFQRAFKIALCVAASTLTLLPPFKNGNVCGSEIFF